MKNHMKKRLLAGLMAVTVTASLALTGCAEKTEAPEDVKTPVTEEPAADVETAEKPVSYVEHVDEDGKFVPHDYEVADMSEEDAALVVATSGDATMDNVILSFYYWQQYYNFVNQYGQYAAMMMDFSKPLSEQMMDDTHSFQDAYLQSAVEAFHGETAAYQEAMANGYVLDEATQTYLDTMEDDMNEYFAANGFESGAAYLSKMFGEKFTMELYQEMVGKSLIGNGYLSEKTRELDVSMEAKEAYYDSNEEQFTSQGISKDEANPVNVRHLLVMPVADEGAETDETGAPVLTDANWKTAEDEANRLYEEWKNGDATEESFAALATEHSEDGGSAANGGLYENVYVGQMVPEFEAWSFDTRAYGDTGIVKTSYGYHIMYFVSQSDTPRWPATAEELMLNEEYQRLAEEAKAKYPLTVDYSKAKLFPSPAEEENRAMYVAQAEQAGE